MVRKAPAGIALILAVLLAAPALALIGRVTRSPAVAARDHLTIDLERPLSGVGDPLLGRHLRQACGSAWSRVPRYAAYLQSRGRLAAAWRPRWDRTVILTVRGRAYPAAVRSARYGGGSLTFTYTGWTTAERTALSTYVNAVYPVIRSIYGPSASTITVNIVRDPQLQDLLGGVYVPATNEIRLPPLQDFSRDTYVLASLIVRAFHDDLFIASEVWETGFARAVALVAHLQVDTAFDLRGEPYYLLPVYDLLNQRPLASPTIFPPSGFTGMTFWRIGMAQAAWLKVYAENPDFFRDFNAAYYAEYNPAVTPKLSENLSRLRLLAAAAAPQVEGAPFDDWFARQYVLDTTGAPGEKLFLAALPQTDNLTVFLEADYYRATVTGDEQPLAATGTFHFMGWDGDLYLPEAGDSMPIGSGQGFLSPTFLNIGGAQRITIELAAGNQIATSWFPYGVVARTGIHNEYFGVVVDGDAGTVSITPQGLSSRSAGIVRGVFSIDEPQALDSLVPTAVEVVPTAGVQNLRQVNTGFLYHVFALRAFPLQAGTVQRTFPAGLAMVSLPLSPDRSDAAAVLGLARTQTLLARWNPAFNRYAFYPDTPPIEPGLGYWLKLAAPLTVTAHGLRPAGEYRLHLRRGWQQVANPFSVLVPLSAVRVQVADNPAVTLQQAQTAGAVSALLRYSNGSYVVAGGMRPWEGLFLYVYPAEGCWLIIQEP